jgi:hypothetical protein
MRIASVLVGALLVAAGFVLAQAQAPPGGAPQGQANVQPQLPVSNGNWVLGPDRPGAMRGSAPEEEAALDAGLAPDGGELAQAQPQDAGLTNEQRENLALRARLQALERERFGTQQQQLDQGDQMIGELQGVRQQLEETEARRLEEKRLAAEHEAAVVAGVSALQHAQNELAYGNYQVLDQISQAEQSFPPQAQRQLAYARDALRNGDLSMARGYIAAAIADAHRER